MRKTLSAVAGFVLLLSGCAPDEAAWARGARGAPSAFGVARSQSAVNAAQAPSAATAATFRFVTAAGQNAARYRVREQLAGFELPNDAVGETKAVSGMIAADAKGKVIAAESKFTIDAATLTSDRDRRDNYLRRRTLLTEQYPSVTLVPTAVRGLTFPLPTAGSRTFELVGDLTVRDVTRPTVWRVTAQFGRERVTGSASTAFTFDYFDMQQPRVGSVLSIADTIKLELDFTLVPEPGKSR